MRIKQQSVGLAIGLAIVSTFPTVKLADASRVDTRTHQSVAMAPGELAGVGSSWEELTVDPSGDDPFPLDSFAACAFDTGEGGYIFGGGSAGFFLGGGDNDLSFPDNASFAEFNNRLYRWQILDAPTQIKFTQVAPAGDLPSIRGFPEIACTPENVYLYGGASEGFSTVSDSFWQYDTQQNVWTDLSAAAPAPGPRNSTSMQISGDRLYLFGGVVADVSTFSFEVFNDFWQYDLSSQAWELLTGDGDLPTPKHLARADMVETDAGMQLVLFGGEQFEPSTFAFPIDRELHVLDVQSGSVSRKADGPEQNYGAFGCSDWHCLLVGGDIAGSLCGDSPQKITDATWLYDIQADQWQQIDHQIDNNPPATKRSRGVWSEGYFYRFGGYDIECDAEGNTQKGSSVYGVYRLRLD